MKEKILPSALKYADKARKLYWKTTKPVRFGVKGLVFHHNDSEKILVVRHSYGNTNRLNLPGGGYKPKKETPEQSLRRELLEELGLALADHPVVLDEIVSQAEGKKDNITIFAVQALSEVLHPNAEIAEAMWVPTDLSGISDTLEVSGFVSSSLQAHAHRNHPYK